MRRRVVRWLDRGSFAATLAVAGALPAGAQVIPVGAQFQANAYTTGSQTAASVGVAPDGDFVVVWQSAGSFGADTSATGILGQLYASDGSTVGGEFQVNTYTTGSQEGASVAVAPDGDFVVVWESDGSSGGDTNSRSIQGQRYASDGSAQGGEFQVNGYTTGAQTGPAVAVASDGDFVVVWTGPKSTGNTIQGQLFASDGSPQGSEFQVDEPPTLAESSADVAAEPDGDFVVVWQRFGSSETDTHAWSVQGRRFASSGSALGGQFQVNTYTTMQQDYPSVDVAPSGDFVVVWHSDGSFETDTDNSGSIQGQRYASNGSALGGEFQVNTYTTSIQHLPAVAVVDGEFVVAWESRGSFGTDTSYFSVQARRYASDGSPAADQFQVNSYTTSYQTLASVAGGSSGFVVAWTSLGSATDASDRSVQGQRYAALVDKVPSLSPGAAAAGALLVLLAAGFALRRRTG